jgi:hypothetical protein
MNEYYLSERKEGGMTQSVTPPSIVVFSLSFFLGVLPVREEGSGYDAEAERDTPPVSAFGTERAADEILRFSTRRNASLRAAAASATCTSSLRPQTLVA